MPGPVTTTQEQGATPRLQWVPGVVACPECDLLHRDAVLDSGSHARCVRCGAPLASGRPGQHAACLALTLAGIVTYAIAQLNPIVGLEAQGQVQSSTLLQAVLTLWTEGAWLMSVLVFLTTVAGPALELLAICHLLLAARLTHVGPGFAGMLRLAEAIEPWVMVEVFMLGVLVAVVKLSSLAAIVPGAGLWAFAALMLLLTLAAATLEVEALWARVGPRPGRADEMQMHAGEPGRQAHF